MPAMREGFTPPSEDEETSKVHKTDGSPRSEAGEAKRAKDKDAEKRAKKEEATKRAKQEALQERAKAQKERENQEELESERAKKLRKARLTFAEAKQLKDKIRKIQEEQQIKVDSETLRQFRELLSRSKGYSNKQLEGMSPARIVVEAQALLRYAHVEEATTKDLADFAGSEASRQTELELLNTEIEKAKGSNGEEILTEEKVSQYVSFQDEANGSPQAIYEGMMGSLPVAIYQRPDGSYIISRLPSNKYDSKTVKDFLSNAQIKVDLPTNWEDLAVDDRINYLEKQGIDTLPEARGQLEEEGEHETEQAVQTLPLREIIAKLKILVRTGDNTADNPQWITWMGRLQEAINEFNLSVQQRQFLNVYDFVTTIEDAIYTSEHYEPPLPDGREAIEILETFLTSGQIENFKRKFEDLDKEFQKVYDRMDDTMRKILLEDLEIALGTQLQGIIAGWNKPENVRAYVFGGIYVDMEGNTTRTRGIIDKVSRDYEKSIGEEVVGLREWRATKEIYGTEESVSIDLLTKPPARWQEVPERISNIYRFVERTDYTPEQLQEYIGKAIRMIERVQTEDSEGRRILNELNTELKAFQAFHTFRVQLERATMNPETLINVFQNIFDDETWVNFAKRFSHDSRLRKFMSENDQEYLNLLDEAISIYFGQLEDERKRMNSVEEMTKRELRLDARSSDEKIVIFEFVKKLSPKGNEVLFGKIKNVADLDDLSISEKQQLMKIVNKVWRYDIANMRDAIQSWLDNNTLLGAFGKDKDGVDILDKRRVELRERFKQVLVRRGIRLEKDERYLMLEQQLREKYTGEELERKIQELRRQRTDELITELEKSGFFEAVDKNAYHLAWSFAWSDFDIIRIYGVNFKTKKLAEVPQEVAFAQHTKMFYGRHIDHFMDFIINEERGRGYEEDEVNAIFRKKLLGEHGNLFPQNRTMVRFARHFMTREQLEEVDRRAGELMKKHDFVPDESYRKTLEDERAADRSTGSRDPYFEGFSGWARSTVIAEMIDSGDTSFFSFSEARFSKIAHKIRQFEMIDLYADRNLALKYFGRENLQGYFRDPSNERFLQINDKDSIFYSGRNIRLWPWMTLAYRIHWEIAHHHWKRLLNKDNMQSAQGEALVEEMKDKGLVKKEQGDYLMHETLGIAKGFLGTMPFRRFRQTLDTIGYTAWEGKWLPFSTSLAMLWEFLKRLLGYSVGGLGEGR